MKRTIIAISAAIAVLLVLDGYVFVSDQARFCGLCHEMRPYYDAFQTSPHKSVACVDCHTGSSVLDRVVGRYPTVRELAAHVRGEENPPPTHLADVSDDRCVRCHPKPRAGAPTKCQRSTHPDTACVRCHSDSGHSVPVAALQAVHLYSGLPASYRSVRSAYAAGSGASNIVGHKRVSCSSCHDMGATGCSACHTARHRNNARLGSDCESCHEVGRSFEFTHPLGRQCSQCHATPLDHPARSTYDCKMCHQRPRVSWESSVMTETCSKCHAIPSDHSWTPKVDCAVCHKRPGVSWKINHPDSSTECGTCHDLPTANHPPGPCTLCHSSAPPSFAFDHPKVRAVHGIEGIRCEKCHPNSYTEYVCLCHK